MNSGQKKAQYAHTLIFFLSQMPRATVYIDLLGQASQLWLQVQIKEIHQTSVCFSLTRFFQFWYYILFTHFLQTIGPCQAVIQYPKQDAGIDSIKMQNSAITTRSPHSPLKTLIFFFHTCPKCLTASLITLGTLQLLQEILALALVGFEHGSILDDSALQPFWMILSLCSLP